MKTELKVGIFAIVVILIISYMTFRVSGLGVAWKRGYTLNVVFDNVGGLDEKSRVKVAGVDAGIVEKVWLEQGKANLTLRIKPNVRIYEDAKASLRAAGLLGDKYLALSAGTPTERVLKDGDWIKTTEAAADIDALASELTSAAAHINDLAEAIIETFGKSERKAITETIYNLKSATESLDEILREGKEPLKTTLVQLKDFSGALQEKGPGLIDDLSKVARELREVIEENRNAFKKSVENIKAASESAGNIAQKIEKGEGTLGKLLKDDKLYGSLTEVAEGVGKTVSAVDRLRTFMDFRTEYLTRESDWKGYFNLTLQPRKDKYYILGVVSDPLGASEITETTVDGETTRTEEIKRKIEFTAQFAKRFEDLALRVGLMENTFGLGADYFLKFFGDDKVKISLDMWDFNAYEARAERAHFKIGVDYRAFKNIFISSGIDNILNSDRIGIYVGGGVKFEDEDFKYIFGASPNLPTQ